MSTVAATFEQISRVRPGYTPWVGFVVQNGTAVYTLSPTDRPDLPFSHKLTGNHGDTYGYWSEVSGTPTRIRRSGYSGTRGVLGTFDTRDEPNLPTMRVKGWAVLNAAL